MIIGWKHKGDLSSVWQGNLPYDEAHRLAVQRTISYSKCRCELCGYQALHNSCDVVESGGFMTVLPKDKNFDNISTENLVSVCVWCQASQCAIDALASDQYRLVLAPWISQDDLFHFVRTNGSISCSPSHLYYSDAAQRIAALENLEASMSAVFPHLPAEANSRSEAILSTLRMISAVETDQQYMDRWRYISNVRLLPVVSSFTKLLSKELDREDDLKLDDWGQLPEWYQARLNS